MVESGPFVGRDRQLAELLAAFERARDGHGGAALVTGEPGIGKTRLVRELEAAARADGAAVLWGRAPDVDGVRPYWPWSQTLDALRLAADQEPLSTAVGGADGLRGLLGDSAVVVARVAPFLFGPVDLTERPTVDTEAARFDLFVAIERLMREVSRVAPLLIVFDDLQWADPSSRSLLELVSSSTADTHTLIVAVCRTSGLDAIGDTLAALSRSEGFISVELSGLDITALAGWLTLTTGQVPSAELVQAWYDRTGGNPYFVRELLAAMGEGDSTTELLSRLPRSIRAAIERRLDDFEPDDRDVLRYLALLDRAVSQELLAHLAGRELLAAVEVADRAVAAGLLDISESPVQYRFTHDLVREALTDGLPARRRAELHAALAEALESANSRVEHIGPAELAEHFVAAARTDRSMAARAVDYSELAGRAAGSVWAWSEAIGHYEDALALVGHIDDGRAREAALLLALGCAQRDGNQFIAAIATLKCAVERFRELGDWPGFSRAVLERQLVDPRTDDGRELVREALEHDDGSDPERTAHLYLRLSREWFDDEATAASAKAERLADAYGIRRVKAEAVFWRALATYVERGLDAALPIFEEAHQRIAEDGDPRRMHAVANAVVRFVLEAGRLQGADAWLDELRRVAGARQDATGLADTYVLLNEGTISFLHGDLTAIDVPPPPAPAPLFVLQNAVRAEVAGDLERALILATAAGGPYIPERAHVVHGTRARIVWRARGAAEARTHVEQWRKALEEGGHPFLRLPAHAYATLDDAMFALCDDALLAAALEHLETLPDSRAMFLIVAPGLDQLRGALALHFDRVDDAERWYRTGADWAAQEDCPIELGRNLAGLAEVAERRGRRATALRRLERAIESFAGCGALLWRDQARSRLDELRAAARPGHPRYPAGLSQTEVDVLRLVAQDLSNAEIAEARTIALATVKRHVTSILRKTNTQNRRKASTWAVDHRLLD
jgi:DNA-binding CsgD family transcriptional regulator